MVNLQRPYRTQEYSNKPDANSGSKAYRVLKMLPSRMVRSDKSETTTINMIVVRTNTPKRPLLP
jgi:uncharacterized protein with WD repeat